MKITHLLDTSVYSQPMKPVPHPNVERRWRMLGDAALGISTMCIAEIHFGLEFKGSKKLWERYEELLERVAAAFGELKSAARKRGRPIADADLLIAATAKVERLIIATLNYRHFEGLPGVATEDWSK